MNEPETARILRRDAPSVSVTDASMAGWGRSGEPKVPSSRFPLPRFGVCRSLPVSVEPVMFLTMFSVALHDPLSMQYLWARISEDLGYNRSKTSECSGGSLPRDPLQKVACRTSFMAHLQQCMPHLYLCCSCSTTRLLKLAKYLIRVNCQWDALLCNFLFVVL